MINELMKLRIIFVCVMFSDVALACPPLPDELTAYMQSLDVRYSLIDKENLHPQVKLAYEDAIVCVVDDFDGDGRTDYALAVTDPNPPLYDFQKANVKIIVFFGKLSGYVHKILPYHIYFDLPDPNEIGLIMIPVTGEFEALDETIQLKNTGIQLQWLYIPVSYVFYWKDSDFVQVQISD